MCVSGVVCGVFYVDCCDIGVGVDDVSVCGVIVVLVCVVLVWLGRVM